MEGCAAVDIEAQRAIQLGELPISVFTNEAIIADHLAHNRAIFLRGHCTDHFSDVGVPA